MREKALEILENIVKGIEESNFNKIKENIEIMEGEKLINYLTIAEGKTYKEVLSLTIIERR